MYYIPLCNYFSAGIGRTGTFIALDVVVNQAQDQDYVDVFACVEALINQRVNMVQTQVIYGNAYLFIYHNKNILS
jgi:protein tyrosine phosphatase